MSSPLVQELTAWADAAIDDATSRQRFGVFHGLLQLPSKLNAPLTESGLPRERNDQRHNDGRHNGAGQQDRGP